MLDIRDKEKKDMDIEVLNAICRIARENSVAQVEVSRGDVHIKVRIDPSSIPAVQSTPSQAEFDAAQKNGKPPEPSVIKSDNVGIFFNQPSALEKPYAKPGDTIRKGQTVGLITSMGINHSLKSLIGGKIISQKVKNKEPVEYGEVIFEVEEASNV
jgi:acetyl-CoA carboxylase biotin carboxyl carrier protein